MVCPQALLVVGWGRVGSVSRASYQVNRVVLFFFSPPLCILVWVRSESFRRAFTSSHHDGSFLWSQGIHHRRPHGELLAEAFREMEKEFQWLRIFFAQ